MFHHRGTSTRGCSTRRMECRLLLLLLLLGRQQTAGWESRQEERQESQSECQLAGLRLQRRHVPQHAHIQARMHISMQVHAAVYIQANMRTHSPVTPFMLGIRETCTCSDTHTPCTCARPVPLAARLSTAQACDTEAEGICCGLLLD